MGIGAVVGGSRQSGGSSDTSSSMPSTPSADLRYMNLSLLGILHAKIPKLFPLNSECRFFPVQVRPLRIHQFLFAKPQLQTHLDHNPHVGIGRLEDSPDLFRCVDRRQRLFHTLALEARRPDQRRRIEGSSLVEHACSRPSDLSSHFHAMPCGIEKCPRVPTRQRTSSGTFQELASDQLGLLSRFFGVPILGVLYVEPGSSAQICPLLLFDDLGASVVG